MMAIDRSPPRPAAVFGSDHRSIRNWRDRESTSKIRVASRGICLGAVLRRSLLRVRRRCVFDQRLPAANSSLSSGRRTSIMILEPAGLDYLLGTGPEGV
jgi:hypothetical protein